MQYLLQRPDVRHDNIGFAGFDQGGWIAPLAASATPEIAFVILASVPMLSPQAPLDYQTMLRRLRPPLLLLWGEKDQTIPVAKSVALVDSFMHAAGKKNYALRVLPDAEHELYTKPYHDSPLPLLQNLPQSPRFDQEALQAMVYWIKVVAPLHKAR